MLLAVSEPEVPVTVSVAVPIAAVLLAVSVRMLLPVVGLGAKDALLRPQPRTYHEHLEERCGALCG